MSSSYKFGAGDFKLGDRVEWLLTKQKGIIIGEVIHVSGCNTFHILFPNIVDEKGKMKCENLDFLVLRKLNDNEAVFNKEKSLDENNIFSLKGTDIDKDWILKNVEEGKEPIPEIDEALGIDELDETLLPGVEVWNKIYNLPMLIVCISREIYSKELDYTCLYMVGDKKVNVSSKGYALIPMEKKIDIYKSESNKQGSLGDEFLNIDTKSNFDIDRF